jgi:ribosomal protein S18 acetylase RimI-like enzyme
VNEFTRRLKADLKTEHLNIYDVPCPDCGATVTSTARTKDDGKALSRCVEGHEFTRARAFAAYNVAVRAQVQVNAAQRLLAVNVSPKAYPENVARQDLELVQDLFNRKRKRIGTDRNGLVFWWCGLNDLVCSTRRGQVVGFVALRPGIDTIDVGDEVVKGRSIRNMYLLPEYRGRGVILGMHQYLITQFNLISDDVYTPDGLNVWKQLKKTGHKVEVTDIYSHGRGKPSVKWDSPHTVLFVRRNQ